MVGLQALRTDEVTLMLLKARTALVATHEGYNLPVRSLHVRRLDCVLLLTHPRLVRMPLRLYQERQLLRAIAEHSRRYLQMLSSDNQPNKARICIFVNLPHPRDLVVFLILAGLVNAQRIY